MKVKQKISTFLLIAVLSLGIGVVAFAATSGYRILKNSNSTKTAEARAYFSNSLATGSTSLNKYYFTDLAFVSTISYDKNGIAISADSENAGVCAVASVVKNKKVKKVVTTHAIKNRYYKPYCSIRLTILP